MWPVNQFPDWSQFVDPKALELMGGQDLLMKDLDKISKSFTVSLFLLLLQRVLWPSTIVTLHCEKENNHTF